MATRHFPAPHPRLLASILADIAEAKDDYDNALADEHEDRSNEAETRLDDLREEAAARFARDNGITIEGFRGAIERGLI